MRMDIYQEQTKIFKAFCDENRLHVLELLRDGEKCACVLLEQLNCGQPTLSYHMKILVESGVVVSRQQGKRTFYRISEKGCSFAKEQLEQITKTKPNKIINIYNCCNEETV